MSVCSSLHHQPLPCRHLFCRSSIATNIHKEHTKAVTYRLHGKEQTPQNTAISIIKWKPSNPKATASTNPDPPPPSPTPPSLVPTPPIPFQIKPNSIKSYDGSSSPLLLYWSAVRIRRLNEMPSSPLWILCTRNIASIEGRRGRR